MASLDQPKTSYSDTTPQKRAISDVISMIDPRDTPFLAWGGLNNESKFRLVNWPGTSYEGLEDTMEAIDGLSLNGSITSTQTTVTVDDGTDFKVGDVLLVDSEYLVVSNVNTGTNVLTVYARNYGGTQATHADNAVIAIIGMARLEGAESDTGPVTDVTSRTFYTQIFQDEVKVTRTQNQLQQYGIGKEFDYQAAKKVPHLMRLLERSCIRGVSSAGSATTPRSFAGFHTHINVSGANTISAGGAVVQADFEDALEAAYNDGGMPTVAFVSPANMQVIKNFYDSASFLNVKREDTVVGMVINRVHTPFGDVDLVIDRWMPDSFIDILDERHVGVVTLFPFTQEPLAKTGDYERGQVVGEFGLVVRHPTQAHAAIIAIS